MSSFHLDSDAVSAAVDAETTAEEQAHLADCPACLGQVEQLRAVSRLVGAAVAPRSPVDVDAAIRAAMESVGHRPASTSETAGGHQLASQRARNQARWAGRRVLAAAAVIVALLGVGGLARLVLHGSGSSTKASTSLEATGRARGSKSAAPNLPAAGGPLGAAAGPTTTAGPALRSPAALPASHLPDLGAQTNPVALAGLIDSQAALPAPASRPTSQGAESTAPAGNFALTAVPCELQGAAALGLSPPPTPVYAATLTWKGQKAVVLAYSRPSGMRVAAVMSLRDCTMLAAFPV